MINFIEKLLHMPKVVLTVMVLFLIGGVAAYQSLPKEGFPSIDIPYFYVSVSQTGIAPKDAERLIARPVEDRLDDLDDLKNMTSTSTTGHVSVFLEFDVNADKDKALSDIRAKLDGVSTELPTDAKEPTITEISFTDRPVLNVAIYGDVPERTLIRHANELKKALEGLPSVQSVTLSGDREEVLEVTIDQLRLEAYDLTAAQLFNALAINNAMVAGGTIDSGQGSFNVEVPGLISTADEVFSLPLTQSPGNVAVRSTLANFGPAGLGDLDYSAIGFMK